MLAPWKMLDFEHSCSPEGASYSWDLLEPWNVFWADRKEVIAIGYGAKIRRADGLIFIGKRALYAIDVLVDYAFKPWTDANGWIERADISPSLAEVFAEEGAAAEVTKNLRQTHAGELLATLQPAYMEDENANFIFDDHWDVLLEREENNTSPLAHEAVSLATHTLPGMSVFR